MDWTNIIISFVTLLLGGGGLVAFLTVNAKKYQAMVESVEKTNEQWQHIADERTHRAEELKAELDKKDDKIDELYKEQTRLRKILDNVTTGRAVAELMRCECIDCIKRRPPYGEGLIHKPAPREIEEHHPDDIEIETDNQITD